MKLDLTAKLTTGLLYGGFSHKGIEVFDARNTNHELIIGKRKYRRPPGPAGVKKLRAARKIRNRIQAASRKANRNQK